ncbi:MAG: hypothetical protein COV10_03085 [Candidatus Vogelbacteria bacterium CG10_big_fil_rev_8_21_14_0_10_51_16]|uniref:Uncharacterized protein n=1 Tax=Candidatus Vogelbacteria bacterium CG10_big_fil_rev_8_21_14_0_10_51_16 TaxID=1975045 RepID=A0A2H0REC2_9BACT|nr:MAG: hypothetical protein COV10_03085 [Candidatus Vogelbacteria bacterium CG10_big_fil_rev_8_21_14_0_10_51_16]
MKHLFGIIPASSSQFDERERRGAHTAEAAPEHAPRAERDNQVCERFLVRCPRQERKEKEQKARSSEHPGHERY